MAVFITPSILRFFEIQEITDENRYIFTTAFFVIPYYLTYLVDLRLEKNKVEVDAKVNEEKKALKKLIDDENKAESDYASSKAKKSAMLSSITKKVNFYNTCSEELKKWADLRNSSIITEEEYQEKKEKGQYVNNALSSISFVVELIYNKAIIADWFTITESYRLGNLSLRGYNIPTGHRDFHKRNKRKNKQWVDCSIWIPELIFGKPPQIIFKEWLELRKSNAITEEEYQKFKEEFLKVEGVNEGSDTTDEIKAWSSLRDLNAITEEEFQNKKSELLDSIGKNEDK